MTQTMPVSIDSAEHYLWGGGCDGWHLLERDDLSVIRERVPPGARETRHRHVQARQFFYVLDGAAVIEVDGVLHALATGQGLHVPPGAGFPSRVLQSSMHAVLKPSCAARMAAM